MWLFPANMRKCIGKGHPLPPLCKRHRIMRRTATIMLHWLSFVLLVLLLAGGPSPALSWAFGLSALGMCVLAITGGLMNGPGPKLEGPLRTAHPWMSRAMYAALGTGAALTLWAQIGGTPGPGTLAHFYVYLFAASALHGIFHLWRHTALNDGALRRITPTIMHGML